jgi:hypothetical protein
MDEIHNTLVWYERARVDRQPPSRPKRGKMVRLSASSLIILFVDSFLGISLFENRRGIRL